MAAIREELNEINAEMARRRRLAEQTKYSPDQPRIPKRNPGGGQWTRIGGGGQSRLPGVVRPMGNVDVGNLAGSSETEGLFNIAPANPGDPGALARLADSGSTPGPIPNADSQDVADNLQDVNARRGGTSNWFPGASAGQQSRLDQAIARSENALTQIRQYDPEWEPRERSLTSPGSVEGAIARVEAPRRGSGGASRSASQRHWRQPRPAARSIPAGRATIATRLRWRRLDRRLSQHQQRARSVWAAGVVL